MDWGNYPKMARIILIQPEVHVYVYIYITLHYLTLPYHYITFTLHYITYHTYVHILNTTRQYAHI